MTARAGQDADGFSASGETAARPPLFACILAAVVCIKAIVTYDGFPGWSTDPTVSDAVIGISLGPGSHLIVNALLITAAMAVCVGRALSAARDRDAGGSGLNPAACVVSALGVLGGAIVVAIHTVMQPATPEAILTASDLLAAFSAGLACMSLAAGSAAHRIVQSIVLGLVVMLAAKGVLQYTIEHSQTLEAFRASRDEILAANGWSPGSASALAYERRIVQREATGWFGLSNVFASVVGAAMVACFGLGVDARSKGTRLGLIAVGLASLTALVLSHSKGGTLAALVGIFVLGVLVVVRKLRLSESGRAGLLARLAPIAFVGLIIAGQGAIVARGLIGEKLGELSLYFRWFYVEGAARIFAEHPLLGTGPGGFKEAYLTAKPPLSPEEVASPHSLPWDLLATLGVGGIALCGAWCVWVWMAGRSAQRAVLAPADPAVQFDFDERTEDRLIALFAAAAGIFCVFMERAATTPEGAIAKMGGLIGWIAASIVINRVLRDGASGIGLCAAAGMLVIHSQIEMTGIWTGASAWFMAIIGLAAAGQALAGTSPPASTRVEYGRRAKLAGGSAAGACLASLVVVLIPIAGMMQWERHLVNAAETVLPTTRLRAELDAISLARVSSAEQDRMLHDAIAAHTNPGEITPGQPLEPQVVRASVESWIAGLKELSLALEAMPSEFQTRRAASSLALRIADAMSRRGDAAARDRYILLALEFAEVVERSPADRASAYSWKATVRLSLISAKLAVDEEQALTEAKDALIKASERDPYNFQHAVQLARISKQMGDAAGATAWAKKALELEALQRLDPLKRIEEASRSEIETLAKQ
jgi:hypothetical protein